MTISRWPDSKSVLEGLLAMAADRGPRRPTVAEQERRKRSLRRNQLRRQREALVRRSRRRAAAWRGWPEFGERIVDRMIAGMDPGGWYGAHDIARIAGMGRHANGKVRQVLLPAGLVERASNPQWRGAVSPQKIMAGAVAEPRFVYRLTEKGEMYRAAVLLVW